MTQLYQLALHDDQPNAIVVSQVGSDRKVRLPKREIVWTRMSKRFVDGPKRLKLQMVEVDVPDWLARDRGLTR